MITIVDYGMGNLRSVWKAFEAAGAQAKVSDQLADIESASGIVLPGQGAFAPAMKRLRETGLLEPVLDIIRNKKKPFLGICLGLQLLVEESEEDGPVEGFGIIHGKCRRFVTDLKVPHMGWNQVEWTKKAAIFEGIESGSYFYFVHSYYVDTKDPDWACGTTDYEVPFSSAVAAGGHRYAVQFHPEKSQEKGLQILKNFTRIVEKA